MKRVRATFLLVLMFSVAVLLSGCSGGGGGGGGRQGGSGSTLLSPAVGGSTLTYDASSPLITLRPPVPVQFQSAGQFVPSNGAGLRKVGGQSAHSPKAADFNGDGLADILMGSGVQLQQPDRTFGVPISIGEIPPADIFVSVFSHDVTEDGQPDVVSVSTYHRTVLDPALCVFVNRGDGTFLPRIGVPVSASPLDAAFGDIDADGHVDLVVAQRNGVFWHRGAGDGTFGPERLVWSGPAMSSAVLCEDLNGDGRADVFVVEADITYVHRPGRVCLSNGDGTFTVGDTAVLDSESSDVASGDFNGDGKRDIAVASADVSSSRSAVWALLGNGDGTFETPRSVIPNRRSFNLVAGDVNGDGFDDIVFSYDDPEGANVLLSNGDGTFTRGRSYSGSLLTYQFSLQDMNGDGRLDLLVSDNGGSRILKGNGDGTFDGRCIYNSGGNADAMVAGDVTGDGCPDVAVANTDNSTVTLYVNRGDGTLGSPVVLTFPDRVGGCALADLDGDGRADLVVAEWDGVSVLRGTASGVGPPVHYGAFTAGSVACVVTDLDHDGKADVVVGNTYRPRGLVVFHGNGDGTLGAVTALPIDDELLSLVCGDVTEDGFTDVIACCHYSLCVADSVSGARVVASEPVGSFPAWATRFPGIGQMTLLPAGDLENDFGGYRASPGDLHLDLVFGSWVMLVVTAGNGQGQFPTGGATDTRQMQSCCAAVADMDLDGLPDVVSGSDLLAIYRGTGAVLQQTPPLTFPLQYSLRQAVVADMNRDGLPDVLAQLSSSQYHRMFTVMLRKP